MGQPFLLGIPAVRTYFFYTTEPAAKQTSRWFLCTDAGQRSVEFSNLSLWSCWYRSEKNHHIRARGTLGRLSECTRSSVHRPGRRNIPFSTITQKSLFSQLHARVLTPALKGHCLLLSLYVHFTRPPPPQSLLVGHDLIL